MAIGTVRNYVKSIKLFCDMADVHVPWAKLGLSEIWIYHTNKISYTYEEYIADAEAFRKELEAKKRNQEQPLQ
jgi:hypothetical protein